MNFILSFRVSIRSLGNHKGRSLLTMLGIVIGISAIIATLAIGKGAEEKTRQQFLALGNNYMEIFADNWYQEGKTTQKRRKSIPAFEDKIVSTIKRLCPEIRSISPITMERVVVTYKNNNIFVQLKGGNESFIKILGRKIHRGSNFNKHHVIRKARVAVLGSKSAKELFKTMDPIGKTVLIKGVPFIVIGIIQKMENYHGTRDPNFDIFIPYRTMRRDIYKISTQLISGIVLSAPSKQDMPYLKRKIQKILRFKRGIKEGESDNFTVFDQASIMKAAQSAASTVRLLLMIIASISLLVGGIGIMNIMLVSVTERTKEIGVRMALGAKSSTILKQFITEAIIMCFIGGIIGVIIGISVPHAIAHLTSWSPIVTMNSIAFSFLTATSVGLFFGYYPAYKASKLNPVDALMDK